MYFITFDERLSAATVPAGAEAPVLEFLSDEAPHLL
jgi:hypothetical protein